MLADLEATTAEPRDLLAKAVQLVKKYTSVGGAYAAYVAVPEEPDWTPPEDAEDPLAAESEDEADPLDPAAAPEGGEEAAPEAAEGGGGEDEEGEGAGEPGAPKIPRPVDYSKRYLSYAVGTEGHEFVEGIEVGGGTGVGLATGQGRGWA